MTALRKYQRLEATGLWRPTSDAQRREVVVSVGEATLTISDFQNRALTHWSLAAIQRDNPGETPALFHPDGDPDETLELAANETEMIAALDRLRLAVDRSRPRPGRLRLVGMVTISALVIGLLVFWLPGAMRRHALEVVPKVKRMEIGEALLDRLERVAGRACRTTASAPALARLARRLEVREIVVLPAGVRSSLNLPGSVVLLNKALIEDYEDPAVAAGYVLAERTRAELFDPLGDLLRAGGVLASFRLLTTGEVSREMLDRYAEMVIAAPRPALPDDRLLAAFAKAEVPSRPYAMALDITGESVLGLVEADPMTGLTPPPVLKDRDWVQVQNICGG
ncbi:hypothetical protein [Seohaeicola zhoushanensis]|uniref:Uncharacterized protein n=1 Tax=Seohaeicola zhoushanensis TaxID=1569283 RepID=A0A8J3H0H0_9RHOB|nr:hypothetical protein [Seohaeicola zhoushanensis]GHF60931.1 hypothetical protein GCM10017056_35420 [Seohaeicola zhoushanensis]